MTVGTTAKLTRALWIATCTLVTGFFWKSEARAGFPLFIIGFIAAAFINSWLPAFDVVWGALYALATQALVMTLFLIGAGLTKQVLKQIGLRPLLLGVLLWIVAGATTLLLILKGSLWSP